MPVTTPDAVPDDALPNSQAPPSASPPMPSSAQKDKRGPPNAVADTVARQMSSMGDSVNLGKDQNGIAKHSRSEAASITDVLVPDSQSDSPQKHTPTANKFWKSAPHPQQPTAKNDVFDEQSAHRSSKGGAPPTSAPQSTAAPSTATNGKRVFAESLEEQALQNSQEGKKRKLEASATIKASTVHPPPQGQHAGIEDVNPVENQQDELEEEVILPPTQAYVESHIPAYVERSNAQQQANETRQSHHTEVGQKEQQRAVTKHAVAHQQQPDQRQQSRNNNSAPQAQTYETIRRQNKQHTFGPNAFPKTAKPFQDAYKLKAANLAQHPSIVREPARAGGRDASKPQMSVNYHQQQPQQMTPHGRAQQNDRGGLTRDDEYYQDGSVPLQQQVKQLPQPFGRQGPAHFARGPPNTSGQHQRVQQQHQEALQAPQARAQQQPNMWTAQQPVQRQGHVQPVYNHTHLNQSNQVQEYYEGDEYDDAEEGEESYEQDENDGQVTTSVKQEYMLQQHAQRGGNAQGDGHGRVESRETEDEPETFDVEKFDFAAELVYPWDQSQSQVAPVLRAWSESMIRNTFEQVYAVNSLFVNSTQGCRIALEEGLKRIFEAEERHEQDRHKIISFRTEIADAAKKAQAPSRGGLKGMLLPSRFSS